MIWNRSETLALASHTCGQCQGLGLKPGRGRKEGPCNCVLRSIFRLCYSKFRECVNHERYLSHTSTEPGGKRVPSRGWGRKAEEYVADFCLIAKRELEPEEHDVFRYHFLLGADWRLCCRQLNINRGQFFHHVYRIQQHLGRIFRELEPYGLFPIDEYFHGPRLEHSGLQPDETTRQKPGFPLPGEKTA